MSVYSSLSTALVAARTELADVDSPALSAEVLLAHSLGLQRSDLLREIILNPNRPLSPEQASLFQTCTARRRKGEPVAYIVGSKEFYGRPFRVTPHTLIPRPETELLVETALRLVHESAGLPETKSATNSDAAQQNRCWATSPLLFADLGTGSGCIAVTLALELPNAQGLAVDKSQEALAIAQENAVHLHAANLRFAHADFTQPVLADASMDLIVSNPPYISEEEYCGLDPEVRSFEPKFALVPEGLLVKTMKPVACNKALQEGATGFEHIAAVVGCAERALRTGGWLLIEIGHAQGVQTLALVGSDSWVKKQIYKDIAGCDRLLVARKSHGG